MGVRARSLATAGAALALATASLGAGCGGGGDSGPPDRFDSSAAMDLVRMQVDMGPRPAGSAASRRLAERLRALLPGGRFQAVPGGLRNVLATVPGKEPGRVIVVGAHYDTKDIPGFVGAVDGASGTAVAVQLARTLKPRQIGPTVVFALFDGEESPRGTPDTERAFQRRGLRGSKVAARSLRGAEAMVLLDFVGNRELELPREPLSDEKLWGALVEAAERAGVDEAFIASPVPSPISDDHVPFREAGVPAIDLIDFDFPCWHKRCDDLNQVSERSLDVTGEAVLELLSSS
jgi:hypothetical protein